MSRSSSQPQPQHSIQTEAPSQGLNPTDEATLEESLGHSQSSGVDSLTNFLINNGEENDDAGTIVDLVVGSLYKLHSKKYHTRKEFQNFVRTLSDVELASLIRQANVPMEHVQNWALNMMTLGEWWQERRYLFPTTAVCRWEFTSDSTTDHRKRATPNSGSLHSQSDSTDAQGETDDENVAEAEQSVRALPDCSEYKFTIVEWDEADFRRLLEVVDLSHLRGKQQFLDGPKDVSIFDESFRVRTFSEEADIRVEMKTIMPYVTKAISGDNQIECLPSFADRVLPSGPDRRFDMGLYRDFGDQNHGIVIMEEKVPWNYPGKSRVNKEKDPSALGRDIDLVDACFGPALSFIEREKKKDKEKAASGARKRKGDDVNTSDDEIEIGKSPMVYCDVEEVAAGGTIPASQPFGDSYQCEKNVYPPRQLVSYMATYRARYGILTTGYRFDFCKLEVDLTGKCTMHIAGPFWSVGGLNEKVAKENVSYYQDIGVRKFGIGEKRMVFRDTNADDERNAKMSWSTDILTYPFMEGLSRFILAATNRGASFLDHAPCWVSNTFEGRGVRGRDRDELTGRDRSGQGNGTGQRRGGRGGGGGGRGREGTKLQRGEGHKYNLRHRGSEDRSISCASVQSEEPRDDSPLFYQRSFATSDLKIREEHNTSSMFGCKPFPLLGRDDVLEYLLQEKAVDAWECGFLEGCGFFNDVDIVGLTLFGPVCWADFLDERRYEVGAYLPYEDHIRRLPGDGVKIGRGRTGDAYRNNIRGMDVVCKTLTAQTESDVTREEMVDEMRFETMAYAMMHSLQGQDVPVFVYAGSLTDASKWIIPERGMMDGLVTTYAGSSLAEKSTLNEIACHYNTTNEDKESARAEFVEDLTQIVRRVHGCGVLHGDIRVENLVWNTVGKRIMLIDFGNSHFDSSKEEMDEELQDAKYLAAGLASDIL